MRRTIAIVAAIVLSQNMASKADVAFNFQEFGSNRALPTTQTFTNLVTGNAPAVTATAYKVSQSSNTLLLGSTYSATDKNKNAGGLFAKNGGSGKTGLGLFLQAQTEINAWHAIKLDFTKLVSPGYSTITLKIGSIQKGDGFSLFSNHQNLLGLFDTKLASGTGAGGLEQIVTIDASKAVNQVVYLTAKFGGSTASDILLESVSIATSNPEPSSLTIAGISALTFGAWSLLRRRARKKPQGA